MPARKSRKDMPLIVVWEAVPDPDAEQRSLQAYELLLRGTNNPQPRFDKNQQTTHDPDRQKSSLNFPA
jgi:hypothetical protein